MATKKTSAKKAPAPKATKGAKAPAKRPASAKPNASAAAEAKTKKLSAIDAAAKILAGSNAAMNAKTLIEAMAAKGLWTSPGGKTPSATLYSSIIREIATQGKDARFVKTERGKFAANG